MGTSALSRSPLGRTAFPGCFRAILGFECQERCFQLKKNGSEARLLLESSEMRRSGLESRAMKRLAEFFRRREEVEHLDAFLRRKTRFQRVRMEV